MFSFKNLFIGIVHLFVIFLPGSLLLLTILILQSDLQTFDPELNISDTGATLLFIGTSYFLGHIISLVASAIEDGLSTGPRKMELNADAAVIRRVAHDICTRELGREVVSPKSLRKWCSMLVRQENGVLQEGIDSKDADRRFFRNIRLVLLLIFFAVAWRAWSPDPDKLMSILYVFATALLTILAHRRYIDQDAKFTQLVFESLLVGDARKTHAQHGRIAPPTHAGGVVFQDVNGEIEYLLVRPSSDKLEWVLPKGHIKVGESVEEAAVREVEEETGAVVEICAFLNFTYFVVGAEHIRLANYLMRYVEKSEDKSEDRDDAWCNFEIACSKLKFRESLQVLKQANKFASRCPPSRLEMALAKLKRKPGSD